MKKHIRLPSEKEQSLLEHVEARPALAPEEVRCERLLKVKKAILAFQEQLRGPSPGEQVVAIDGKEPKHSWGQHLLTAVVVPSQYYLGSEPVDKKTNEIPVARELIKRLDLEGRLVGLDALHTQVDTARDLVQECGADYLLTIKGNQKGLRSTVKTLPTATTAAPPLRAKHRQRLGPRKETGAEPKSGSCKPVR